MSLQLNSWVLCQLHVIFRARQSVSCHLLQECFVGKYAILLNWKNKNEKRTLIWLSHTAIYKIRFFLKLIICDRRSEISKGNSITKLIYLNITCKSYGKTWSERKSYEHFSYKKIIIIKHTSCHRYLGLCQSLWLPYSRRKWLPNGLLSNTKYQM